jgi:hypothetical protein
MEIYKHDIFDKIKSLSFGDSIDPDSPIDAPDPADN